MRTIRPYVAADRAAMSLVYYRAVREGSAAFYTEAERAAWAPSALPGAHPDKLLDQWCWVAEQEGRMTGFMSLRKDGELDMAFVIPEVMGDGTAAALYDVLLHKAREFGFIRLTVRAAHQSNRFLTRRGWTVTGIEHLEDGGQTYDLFLMAVDLASL